MDTIDCELLISAVQERTPIWMSSHEKHLNRITLATLWNEIAEKFDGIEIPLLKKKWKNLKDHFRKEAKKHQHLRSSDDGYDYEDSESAWPYYQMMKFLLDETISDNPSAFLDLNYENGDIGKENNGSEDNENGDENASDNDSLDDSMSNGASAGTRTSSKRKRATSVLEDFIEIENKKLKLLSEKIANNRSDREKCDDYFFFQTLIPLMKQFSDVDKLRIRNKMNQVILDEIEKQKLK